MSKVTDEMREAAAKFFVNPRPPIATDFTRWAAYVLTLEDHLRKMVDGDPWSVDGIGNPVCNFCRSESFPNRHHDGCDWVAAKAFLESIG